MVKVAAEGVKAVLQFTPPIMQLVAMRVRGAERLPTVRPSNNATDRKGPTMKTISMQARMTSLLLAVVTSAVVLGSTVVGLQGGSVSPSVVVMEKVTIKPSVLN